MKDEILKKCSDFDDGWNKVKARSEQIANDFVTNDHFFVKVPDEDFTKLQKELRTEFYSAYVIFFVPSKFVKALFCHEK